MQIATFLSLKSNQKPKTRQKHKITTLKPSKTR